MAKRSKHTEAAGATANVPDTPMNRLALWITLRVGSMVFFLIIFIWTASWLFWNMFAPKPLRFDPYPGFVLWLFISNMIQLFLMPLILIGQNLQSSESDARAKSDYEINCKAEEEIKDIKAKLTAILAHLEAGDTIGHSVGKHPAK